MTQLHIEPDGPTTSMSTAWSFGIGVGPARMLLRDDIRRQLLLARSELGFHNVRIQGLLGEDSVNTDYDFDPVEQALDWLLENALTPFLLLPAPAQSSVPQWLERVEAMTRAVDGRYGCDAREWHFEIGLNPAGPAGLFEKAASVIKSVHPEYRVGCGPISEYRSVGVSEDLPRAYTDTPTPAHSDTASSPPHSDSAGLSTSAPDFITAAVDPAGPSADEIRRTVTTTFGEQTPVMFCDWGAVASPSFGSDPCACAARVARLAVGLADASSGAIYPALTDITDIPFPKSAEPFHGGRGLLTVNDVRKGAFHALRLLNEHGGYHAERLATRWVDPIPGLGCLATKSEYTLRLLLWLDRDESAPPSAGPVRFTLEGLGETTSAQVEVIRPAAGSAFEAWLAAGRPQFLNLRLLETLEAASHPAMAEVDFREYPPRLEPGMVMQLTIQLPFGD